MNALSPLGMVSETPSSNQFATLGLEDRKGLFRREGRRRSSPACICWWICGAPRNLCDPDYIDRALREAAEAANATILHGHFHHFSPNGGVSGVLVLAESHISIHTWPERDFASIDIFMCGACDPYDSLPALKAAFQPRTVNLNEQRRGLIT